MRINEQLACRGESFGEFLTKKTRQAREDARGTLKTLTDKVVDELKGSMTEKAALGYTEYILFDDIDLEYVTLSNTSKFIRDSINEEEYATAVLDNRFRKQGINVIVDYYEDMVVFKWGKANDIDLIIKLLLEN